MASFEFSEDGRTPWTNKIYPGNYVAHLNAYRDQGVVALPGAVFFRAVGALVINPDNDGVVGTDGVLAAGTYDLQILSPDMRQDDKPRKDRPFVVPEGAVVYRTAVSAPGVREESVADPIQCSAEPWSRGVYHYGVPSQQPPHDSVNRSWSLQYPDGHVCGHVLRLAKCSHHLHRDD